MYPFTQKRKRRLSFEPVTQQARFFAFQGQKIQKSEVFLLQWSGVISGYLIKSADKNIYCRFFSLSFHAFLWLQEIRMENLHWSKLWEDLLIMDNVLIQVSSSSEANSNIDCLWWTGFNPLKGFMCLKGVYLHILNLIPLVLLPLISIKD